jgi:site-specific DNA recombinase
MMPPCTACRRSERLRERMKQIYIDNLDGRIEETIFNTLTAQFREQERKVARELELRLDADLIVLVW